MSRLTEKLPLWKRFVMPLVFATGGILGILYVQALAKLDPLSRLRGSLQESNEERGIRLGDVHLVQYNGERKVGEADVKHVFITSDRARYRLAGVENGLYVGKDGKRLNFSAPQALWNTNYGILQASHGTRVWNKDVDLQTENFRLSDKEQTVYVPSKVEGRVYKGTLVANNLKYSIQDGSIKVGPVHWQGKLALNLQGDGKSGDLKGWDFEARQGQRLNGNKRGDISTFTNCKAYDGIIIVQADKVEWNEATDVVTATGHVQYFAPEANLSCGRAVIYRKEKRAVLTEDVDMLVKPKEKQTKAEIVEIPPFRPIVPKDVAEGRPDAPPVKDSQDKQLDKDLQNPKTARDYPTAITAEKIEYWYGKGKKHAILTGSPQARQELGGGRWRHLWADKALYDGEKETLNLKSREGQADVRMQNSQNSDMTCEDLVVSTKEGAEDFVEIVGIKGKYRGPKYDEDDDGNPPPDPIRPGQKKTGGGGGLKGNIGGGKKPN